ncbi:YncE family protein [Lacinutrix neustonica]|uniref:YncE family protein n=1 Tax=Lacinutrix neustonica TaxID=2980107 RepID=A0A9E8MZL9_9FLAO|nr:DUF5074 domain-containing protein [Lacinutrix neustonica]WAC03179.1 YncE family protein [Lacinutrix neustonica]
MKLNNLALIALVIAVTFTSCSNDDDSTAVVPLGAYENGILISHEGSFSGGVGTVSYVSNDFTTIEHDIFSNVNSRSLGTVAQSMAFNGDFAYIIINVSNQIEVVNRYTFESIATINTGVINPRYMTISNGKGYVTAWGDYSDTTDDALLVVDLGTNTILDTIATSYLPEEIIAVNNKVYVATGIYGNGNKVDVFNSATDELVDSITVGNSPNSLQLDSNNDLWVLSSENLIEINTNSNIINKTVTFDSSISSPSKLNFDSGNLYLYAGGSVYKMDETATDFPTIPEFTDVSFYDMSVRNGLLYGLDAGDFSTNGTLKVFDLTTNTEMEVITVGVIPGEVYFN